MTALMSWKGVDELEPYPWSTIPCPGCGEAELGRDFQRPFDGFVCMNCGDRITIEARRG
jgi:hypothetical protein